MALLCLWATHAWSGPRAQRLYALACLSGALFLVVKSPLIASALDGALASLQALAATGPLWFLIATRRAFGAPAVLTRAQLGMLGGLIGAIALAAAMSSGAARSALFIVLDFAMLAMFVATLHAAWGGLADDLDPGRRAHRIILLNASAAFGVVITVSALTTSLGAVPTGLRAPLETLIALGVFAAAFALCVVTLRPREIELRARPAPGAGSVLAEKILAVLERDKLYRDPALTVASLAQALAAPEHQVRIAINVDLGFKNFSAFINGYRLAEVRAALSDPTQLETPISTIALDAGFGSIASFNRVFKSEYGVAPRDFRRDSTT